MTSKIDEFIEANRERLLMAAIHDPVKFAAAFFRPVLSLHEEIKGVVPMDGPPGLVFYLNFKEFSPFDSKNG